MSTFLLCFTGFETINFYIFFIKLGCFGSNLFFEKYRTTNNYKKRGHRFVDQCFVKLFKKFQGKRGSRSGTGAWGTWQPMIFFSVLLLVHNLNSPDTLPLI